MKPLLTVLLGILCYNTIIAQQYTVNGNATQDDCHTYTITQNFATQSGSVWNNYKIDLSQSFTFTFDIYLGTTDDNGADGIAFVLQPISTSIGGNGSGLGFGGISPSVGVTLDTYQNSIPDGDPFYDHIAIQKNGDLIHTSANNVAGPVTIINGNDNAEDGAWHALKIVWNATTKTLDAYIDGSLRVSRTEDFVATTFANNPLVFWGFTGSTGALFNVQRFKTSLTPQWNFTAAQKRCVNEPITFYDASISFTTIMKIYWDFGDGSNIDSVNINPTHIYTTPGDYTVIQRVKGADGCEETNTQTVRIGSKPVAGFTSLYNCVGNQIFFYDTSRVTVGTINSVFWDFDNNGATSTLSNPNTTYTTNGIKIIKLVVKTIEGCESDTLFKPLLIRARPVADFTFTDSVCLGSSMTFTDNSTLSDGPINGWVWLIDNTAVSPPNNFPNLTHTFLTPGNHTISLATTGTDVDCLSSFVTKNIFVRNKPVADFTNNTICQTVPATFTDASSSSDGASMSQWWWYFQVPNTVSFGPAPVITFNTAGPDTVWLVATTINGCKSDTLKKPIYVNAKPTANFSIDAIKCFGTPIEFSDLSVVNGGTVNSWTWVYNNGLWSSIQNPPGTFNAGSQTIGLAVTSNAGCRSDTVYKTFNVDPKAEVSMNFKDECKNTPIVFTGTDLTGGNINEWHWSFGDGDIANTQNANHTYTANGTYHVLFYGVDLIGCHSPTLERDIIIYGTNAFAGNDTIVAAGQPVQLNAIGGLSYTWTPSTGLSSTNIPNPVATITQTTVYTVKAFTPEGCESYDDIKIEIYKGPEIYIPTAFTPNGDGTNDILRGKPVGIKEFRYMKIYNRWGQEVFSTTDYHNGWDGTWKGVPQDMGVYVVIANAVDFRGNVINKKMTVTLFR